MSQKITVPSVKTNMILNSIKGLMSVLFPLITFPYVSRVLGVAQLGKYNFASSIISYVVLIAGLGIQTYAIREGAKIREHKELINRFSSQIFTINIISTVIAYLIFLLLIFSVSKLQTYTVLLLVLSIQVIFRAIGVEWLFSVFEDFKYITIRSIIFQILSLILMFLLVNDENDLIVYTSIMVFSAVGANVLNYFRSRKYCCFGLTSHPCIFKHLKGILIFFATTVTITIYVSSDTTILGFLCGDFEVGIYSVSVKVYSIVKTILSSAIVVSIPRLSSQVASKESKSFKDTALDIYGTLLTFLLPAVVGLYLLKQDVVLLISGNDYSAASTSMGILAISSFFAMGAYFWGQCVLVPTDREKELLIITVISALVNILLNLILIPLWKENAAAFTTVIAELITFVYCRYLGRKNIDINCIKNDILKIICGCAIMSLVIIIIKHLSENFIISLTLSILSSIIVYFVSQLILGNNYIKSIVHVINKKMRGR